MKLLTVLAASLLASDSATVSAPENTVTVSIQMADGCGHWNEVYRFRVLSEERELFRILIVEDQ